MAYFLRSLVVSQVNHVGLARIILRLLLLKNYSVARLPTRSAHSMQEFLKNNRQKILSREPDTINLTDYLVGFLLWKQLFFITKYAILVRF